MATGRLGAGDTAIQPTILDAKGDLIVATAADTPARLAVGSANQVLTVDSSTATGLKWATLPASGKVLQVVSSTTTSQVNIVSTTLTDTNITATITPSATTSKILIIISAHHYMGRATNTLQAGAVLLRGATTIQNWNADGPGRHFALIEAGGATSVGRTSIYGINYLDSPNTTSAITYKLQAQLFTTANSATINFQQEAYPSTITLMEIGA